MIIEVRVGLELGAAKKLVIHNMYISRSFPDFKYSLQVMLCTQCGQFFTLWYLLGYLKDSNAAAHSVDTGIS